MTRLAMPNLEESAPAASAGVNCDFSQQSFSFVDQSNDGEWGTFRDSLRAPVHRWFTYPAGFSYKAVCHSLKKHQIRPEMRVYDPFAGTGTTNLAAKCLEVDSYGVEAHPFVFQIACVKLDWGVDEDNIARETERVLEAASAEKPGGTDIEALPELVMLPWLQSSCSNECNSCTCKGHVTHYRQVALVYE